MSMQGMSNRQSSGVLLKELAAPQRCPLIEVLLYLKNMSVEDVQYTGV